MKNILKKIPKKMSRLRYRFARHDIVRNDALKLFILIAVALLFSCKQQTFDMISSLPSSSLDDAFKNESKISKLEPPAQIFVSKGLYADTIKVSWSKVYGAESYKLERAVMPKDSTEKPTDEKFNIIPASSTSIMPSSYIIETTYTDVILSSTENASEEYNNVYYYRISAENAKKGYDSSDYIVSEAACLFSPSPFVKADAGESTEEIKVAWGKVPEAKKYELYRSPNNLGTDATKLATLSGDVTSYTNVIGKSEQGIDFYYFVNAINANGHSSARSPLALGYALKEGAPPRVRDVKVDFEKGRGDNINGIRISWTKVEPTIENTEVLYTVYRSSSSDTSLSQIATGIKENVYEDKKSLNESTYYYYQVLAYVWEDPVTKTTQLKSPLSLSSATDVDEEGLTAAAEGFILSPPSEIVVDRLSDTECKLKFSQAIGEEGYVGNTGLFDDYKKYTYKIYGGNNKDDITICIFDTENTPLEAENGYYTTNIDAYKFYRVKTIYGDKASSYSSAVAPSPTAAKNPKATKAAFLEGYTNPDYDYTTAKDTSKPRGKDSKNKFNKNEVYPVKITWDPPEEGADGGYHIFRSTNPDAEFRKITETPVPEGTFEYYDENDSAKPGLYYYYKVLSLNSLGQGSNYTEVCVGYGALTHNQYMREYNKTIQRSQAKLTLMHKPNDLDKVGSETINGDICGTLYYKAAVAGLGAEITMPYTNYSDFFVYEPLEGENPPDDVRTESKWNYYFLIDGKTDTTSNMSANGHMHETVTCSEKGMYPGSIVYDNVEIKGGSAGGGYYTITPKDFPAVKVDYTVGNEGW